MDFIKQNKFLKIALIILAILNVAILLSIWLGKPNHYPKPPAGGNFFVQEVGFTLEQQQQFEELLSEHHAFMGDLKSDMNEKRQALFEDLGQKNVNREVLLNEIMALRKQEEMALLNHFTEVREICSSPEQKERFDKAIVKLIGHLSNGPHRDPHGRRPPPRHRP